jgi:hypothetical protein
VLEGSRGVLKKYLKIFWGRVGNSLPFLYIKVWKKI